MVFPHCQTTAMPPWFSRLLRVRAILVKSTHFIEQFICSALFFKSHRCRDPLPESGQKRVAWSPFGLGCLVMLRWSSYLSNSWLYTTTYVCFIGFNFAFLFCRPQQRSVMQRNRPIPTLPTHTPPPPQSSGMFCSVGRLWAATPPTSTRLRLDNRKCSQHCSCSFYSQLHCSSAYRQSKRTKAFTILALHGSSLFRTLRVTSSEQRCSLKSTHFSPTSLIKPKQLFRFYYCLDISCLHHVSLWNILI